MIVTVYICIDMYWHKTIDLCCNCQGNTTDANKQQWTVVVWTKDSKQEVDLLPCCQRLGQNQALVKAQIHKYKQGLRLQFVFDEIHCKPTSLQNISSQILERSWNDMFGSSLCDPSGSVSL